MYMAHTIVIGALAAELTLLTSPVRAEDPLNPERHAVHRTRGIGDRARQRRACGIRQETYET